MVNKTSNSLNHLKNSNKHLKKIDETTQSLEALKAVIFNSNSISHTKIQFIKEALEAGRYEIHSDHIATKLMENVATEEALEFA